MFGVSVSAQMRSGWSVSVRFGAQYSAAAISVKERLSLFQSRKFAGATGIVPLCRMVTSCSGCR